jgi:voltage-gated potassium channel
VRPLHNIASVFGGLGSAVREPGIRGLLALTLSLVTLASLFYSWIEGWSLLDSTYFAVVTIATVGYGDFAPATTAGKLFTIVYVFAGIGTFVATATAIGQHIVRRERGEREPPDARR